MIISRHPKSRVAAHLHWLSSMDKIVNTAESRKEREVVQDPDKIINRSWNEALEQWMCWPQSSKYHIAMAHLTALSLLWSRDTDFG